MRTFEFRNFEKTEKYISADLYVNGSFVMKLSSCIEHVIKSRNTGIGLYEYFKEALNVYVSNIFYINSETLKTIH